MIIENLNVFLYMDFTLLFDPKFSIHICSIVLEIFHKNCFQPLTLKAIFAPSTV